MAPQEGVREERWVRLSEWAVEEGIPLRTAQRMFHEGRLPGPTRTTEKGRLHVLVRKQAKMSPDDVARMLFQIKQQLNRVEAKLDTLLAQ